MNYRLDPQVGIFLDARAGRTEHVGHCTAVFLQVQPEKKKETARESERSTCVDLGLSRSWALAGIFISLSPHLYLPPQTKKQSSTH